MHICFIHKGREHLGIEYLSGMLKKHGHTTTLLVDPGLFSTTDNVFHQPYLEKLFRKWDTFSAHIAESSYDLLAFSVYSGTYQWACDLAQSIRMTSDIPVVFGGIHPTLMPESVIQKPCIDYVIEGEGEYSLLELVEYLEGKRDIATVRNLYYTKNDTVYRPDKFSFEHDLDRLPLPDKDIFNQTVSFTHDYMMMTTRGCFFHCSFCCETTTRKHAGSNFFRRRSVDSVIHELTKAKENYSSKEVIFFDSIFFNDKEWLKEFADTYSSLIRLPYKCIGHVSFFDEEVARLLKSSGCYGVEFGIETLDEKKKKEILHRSEMNEQISSCLDICDRVQLPYDVNILFGLPDHTEKEYVCVAEFLKGRTFLNRIKCFHLSYYPKTPIVDIAYRKGYLTESDCRKIEEGEGGDRFHCTFSGSSSSASVEQSFKVFFKLFPLFSASLVDSIVKKRTYHLFRFIPAPLVVLLQLLIACKHKDYRFAVQIKNHRFL